MAETTGDLFRSYVRSLRWQVPLALVAVVGMWAFDVSGVREYGLGPLVLIGLGFVVVLSPLLWLRYEKFGQRSKPLALFLLLALAWMVVGTLLLFVAVALVIGD